MSKPIIQVAAGIIRNEFSFDGITSTPQKVRTQNSIRVATDRLSQTLSQTIRRIMQSQKNMSSDSAN